MEDVFRFKNFVIKQKRCAMKVGTDGVLIGAWAEGGQRILDVGTGSGLIALMMAQRFTNAIIDAIEPDTEACSQARENIYENNMSERCSVLEIKLQEYAPLEGYDAIVCNPPYFVNSLKNPDSRRTMARHTDTLPFIDLVRHSIRLLNPNGCLNVILPVESETNFMTECHIAGLFVKREYRIKTKETKNSRRIMLTLVKNRPKSIERQTVVLLDREGTRTNWYRELTNDFYLDI